jgi:hypothetical protein
MIQAFTNSVQALLVVLGITGVSSVALVLLTFAVAEPTWSREMCLSEPWTSSHEKDDEGEDAGSLVVTEKGIGRVGWIALIVFSVVAGYYLWRGTYQAALVFVGMAVLGGISMLTAGSVEMDAEKVIHTNRLGRYGIEWSEVSYIEMHPRGAQVVLHGDDKRLVISGLRVWSGPDGGRMHSLLVAQVRQRQIEVNWTYSTPFRLSKKVRLDSP